jgi:hypothetical protein
MSAYYYLVSSLPSLEADHVPANLDCDELMSHIRENLDEKDVPALDVLLYPGDIRNWINLQASRRKLPEPYPIADGFSTLTREVLLNPVQYSAVWPDFLNRFVENEGERMDDMGLQEMEAALLTLFYDQVTRMGEGFPGAYFARDRSLRNILAACNVRRYGLQLQGQLIGDSSENWQLQHSKTSDFGLSLEFPYIDDILETMELEDPVALEQQVDRIRWQTIDSLLSFHNFDLAVVLGYVLKLQMIRRWQLLREIGSERNPLEQLKADIMRDFVLPEMVKK